MSRIRTLLVAGLAAGILLMSVGVARADNLQATDLVAIPAEHSVEVGQLDATSYRLVNNNGDVGDQQDGCNAQDGSPAVVTINAPATVTVSPSKALTFNACKAPQTVNFSSNVVGNYSITATVADSGGGGYNTSPASFTLRVTAPADNDPPVITAPDITVEATGERTDVEFNATAEDDVDGPVDVTYSDNGPFTAGVHIVTASASDTAGNEATEDFTVTVTAPPAEPGDTTAPVITIPANKVVEATSAAGAVVTYDVSVSDNEDPNPQLSCEPASGSTFPFGETTVNCTATDATGNSASASFKVNVVDTIAPEVTAPDNLEAEATGPSGALVSFSGGSAHDAVDGDLPVTYNPDSGSAFALGETEVVVSATDVHGNTGSATFKVKVVDTTPPALSDLTDVTVEATSADGAEVSYFPATAYDLVNGNVTVVYSQASGSVFPLGTTEVKYSATDAAGNHTDKSFKVTVQDTTAPTLNLPKDVTVYGWNGFFQPIDNGNVVNKAKAGQSIPVKFSLTAGSAVASFSAPTATDLVDGPDVPVSCDHASSSSFPAGDTTVTCSATDAHGNEAEGSFTVHVKGGNQGLNIVAPTYPSFVFSSVSPADATDTVENYAASTPGLTYDAAADQYVYVWKTDKGWAGKSGTLKVKLADGSMHTALFNFTK